MSAIKKNGMRFFNIFFASNEISIPIPFGSPHVNAIGKLILYL